MATALRNLKLFYMHASPGYVPSDLTGDEPSLFHHCAVHRSGGDRITWCIEYFPNLQQINQTVSEGKAISRCTVPADHYCGASVTELNYVLLCGQRNGNKRRPSTCNSYAESAKFSVITRSCRTRRLQSMRWIALAVPRPGAAILHNLRVLFHVLLCEICSEQYLMLNLMYVLICHLIDVLLLLCECTTLWGEREQTALNHCIATDISRVTIYDIIGKALLVKYQITAPFAQEFFSASR